jgi:hypothetical protein
VRKDGLEIIWPELHEAGIERKRWIPALQGDRNRVVEGNGTHGDEQFSGTTASRDARDSARVAEAH